MYCKKCGFENNNDARFCKKCGTMISTSAITTITTEQFCPHCGCKQELNRDYCLNCGRGLNNIPQVLYHEKNEINKNSCLILIFIMIVEFISIWFCDYANSDEKGSSLGDYISNFVSNIDVKYRILETSTTDYTENLISFLVNIWFISLSIIAVIFLIGAIMEMTKNNYVVATQRIMGSAIFLAVVCFILIAAVLIKKYTLYVRYQKMHPIEFGDEIYDFTRNVTLSVGPVPIICLAVAVGIIFYTGKPKKELPVKHKK